MNKLGVALLLSVVLSTNALARPRHGRDRGPHGKRHGDHARLVAQPVAYAMDDQSFDALLGQIAGASFSSGRLGVLQLAAQWNHFSVAQLKRIISLMWFSSERIGAVELVAPRLVDRQNVFLLNDAFPFTSEAEQAYRILGQ